MFKQIDEIIRIIILKNFCKIPPSSLRMTIAVHTQKKKTANAVCECSLSLSPSLSQFDAAVKQNCVIL